MTLEARVDRLEDALIQFMERTGQMMLEFRSHLERTEQVMLEMRAHGARTDSLLVEMQRRADEDRRRADEDRRRADEDRRRADEDRRRADEDRRRADEDRRRAEQERKEFNKRLAELSDSMGTLVEDMVAPNAAGIAGQIFGPDPTITVARRVQRRHPDDPSRSMEIDLLVAGREHVMVVEAKRKITPEKIREFLDQFRELPEFFPEYAKHQLVPVIASVTIEPNVVKFLNRQTVYGVAMGDETMELVNLGQF